MGWPTCMVASLKGRGWRLLRKPHFDHIRQIGRLPGGSLETMGQGGLNLGQRIGNEDIWRGCGGHQAGHEAIRIVRRITHDYPSDKRMRSAGVCVQAASHCRIDDLVVHSPHFSTKRRGLASTMVRSRPFRDMRRTPPRDGHNARVEARAEAGNHARVTRNG